MAVNESRSMRKELLNGGSDGRYKRHNPNWSGPVDPNTDRVRSQLDSGWYGRVEMPLEGRDIPGTDAP